jgi:hypothetical protein
MHPRKKISALSAQVLIMLFLFRHRMNPHSPDFQKLLGLKRLFGAEKLSQLLNYYFSFCSQGLFHNCVPNAAERGILVVAQHLSQQQSSVLDAHENTSPNYQCQWVVISVFADGGSLFFYHALQTSVSI